MPDSERIWDFPTVASLKESPDATQTPEAHGLKTPQDLSTLEWLAMLSDSPQTYVLFQHSALCVFKRALLSVHHGLQYFLIPSLIRLPPTAAH